MPVTNYHSAISVLVPDIVRTSQNLGKNVLVFVGQSKALENYLKSKGVSHENIRIVYKPLNVSFEVLDAKTVIYSLAPPPKHTEQNVFQKAGGNFVMPQIGEVVVHEVHGLGRYLGIKKLNLVDAQRDYIVLQYDGGSFVYLPPEQTSQLSNYVGEPTRLNRIGGQDFANAKQRVRRRLRELSFKLSALYARRGRAKPNTYETDEKILDEFKAAFKHTYTEDQRKALDEIKKDMASNRVMDRLICGDVGFGKTEVAFHAAFRAIMSGYQVALLCPTTILSVQHYNSAVERLGKFGVRVEVLNRFKPAKEVERILGDLASGAIDMVVGTHMLLGERVVFKDLSLLILDEEQRFGVAHKERIKQMRHNVDVLTLSATPIPRTLNMALIGVRDISNILTPPVNRHPIITYVTEYSDELVRDAILREVDRGGQTLVLFNNVERIEWFTARIRKMFESHVNIAPIRVACVHGQMPASRLEQTIVETYNRQVDVLVASTIIENGIDLSTANTLFVIDADRLGVSQMHQIRGRVGRGSTQAFAYFTFSPQKEVSEIARERLLAIQTHSSHGSGFDIAMRDLQLRGAGDLLGANQSGHMEQIGFDMYCKILREVAEENQSEYERAHGTQDGQQPTLPQEQSQPVDPVLDIALDSYIPHEYIENERERMKVYRAISEIHTREDCAKVHVHLADLYGKVPREVGNVILIGYIRSLAKSLGLPKVRMAKGQNVHELIKSLERQLKN